MGAIRVGWAVCVLPLLASAAPAADDLAGRLEAVIDGADYKHAHWGLLVVDAKTGRPLFERNADRMFAPASTTKLYTCAAALVALGKDHRFVTPVYRRGEMSDAADGTLRGDLVLVAQGDLTFGGRTGADGRVKFRDHDHTYADGVSTDYQLTDTDPLAALDDLARQVKKSGINHVDGDVLVDDRLFRWEQSTGSGPSAVGPVVVNDNVIDLLFTPAKEVGQPAAVTVRPQSVYFNADLDVRTGKPGSPPQLGTNGESRRFQVVGSVPMGGKPVLATVHVPKPTEFCRVLFIEALRRNGVRTTASPLFAENSTADLPRKEEYEGLPRVASYTSPPLGEVLGVTLKVSHNLYASTLPLLVGRAVSGGTTLSAGMAAQGQVLKELGVDVGSISFAGGAGGSPADFVTPRATVQLLRAMATRPDWDAYRSMLPVLGEDGTLVGMAPENSPARAHVFAKTGTLYWHDALNRRSLLRSKALAGVAETKAGGRVFFAVFVNNVPLPRGESPSREGKVLARLAELMYLYGPGA